MHHYFSHDSNARHHEKLLALRMKHGWAGYGLYWALIEKLRESGGYKLSRNYELIAFDLRVDAASIQSIISDFGLFVVEDTFFYSQSLCERMEIKDSKSQQASHAAQIRWEKYNAVQKKKRHALQYFPAHKFEPPTEAEVAEYCNERQNGVNPSKFIDFYSSKGWMIGKNKMKDWRAAVRTWERKQNEDQKNNDRTTACARIHPALQS